MAAGLSQHGSVATPFDARSRRGLARGFGGLLGLTTGLIVLGALVRAHGAGLACPDWPFCFGEALPTFDLKIGFEMTHRYVAGSVGLIYAALGAWLLRGPARSPRVVRIYFIGFALLAAQVLLGALTVWELLAEWTVTSHLLTGNAFNVAILLLFLELRDDGRSAWSPAGSAPRAAVVVVAGFLALQMLLGGWVASSYAGMSCPEWPTCNGGLWFPTWKGNVGLHLVHRLNGYALTVAVLTAAGLGWRNAALRPWLAAASALIVGQVVVGVLNVHTGLAVEITGLHSALAAVLVLVTAGTVRAAFRRPEPRGADR